MYEFNVTTTEKNIAREDIVASALGIVVENSAETTAQIVDSETGEVMFIYKNGNVDYIQGDFAVEMVKYAINEAAKKLKN